MAVYIKKPTPKIVFVGDSITAADWMGETGGFVSQLNTWLGSTVTSVNSGVGGNTAADIAGNVSGRITTYSPDVVWILVGVNDIANGVSTNSYVTSVTSIFTQVRAWSPSVPIAFCSVICYGEKWAAGPVWTGNTKDTEIAAYATAVQPVCATYNVTYVDFRAPLLAWESTNNAPAPGASGGVFCSDTPGVHPKAAGEVLLGTWSMPYVTTTTITTFPFATTNITARG